MNAHFFRLGFQAHLWYKLWIISIDKRKGLLSDFMWMGWPGVIIFGSHPQTENFTHWLTGTTGSQISIPRIFGTGFCQIPGFFGTRFSKKFYPGILGNFSRIFIFASFDCQIGSFSLIFIITIVIIITTTIVLHHHHSLRSLLATLLSHHPQIDVKNHIVTMLAC